MSGIVMPSDVGTSGLPPVAATTAENTAATQANTAAVEANTAAAAATATTAATAAATTGATSVLHVTETTINRVFLIVSVAVSLCLIIAMVAVAIIAIRDGNTVEATDAMSIIRSLGQTLSSWAIPTLGAVLIGKPIANSLLVKQAGNSSGGN